MCQPGWEWGLGENEYMYMYGRVPLLFTWNYKLFIDYPPIQKFCVKKNNLFNMDLFQYSPSLIINHLPFWGVWALPFCVTQRKLGLKRKSYSLGHTVGGWCWDWTQCWLNHRALRSHWSLHPSNPGVWKESRICHAPLGLGPPLPEAGLSPCPPALGWCPLLYQAWLLVVGS